MTLPAGHQCGSGGVYPDCPEAGVGLGGVQWVVVSDLYQLETCREQTSRDFVAVITDLVLSFILQ